MPLIFVCASLVDDMRDAEQRTLKYVHIISYHKFIYFRYQYTISIVTNQSQHLKQCLNKLTI